MKWAGIGNSLTRRSVLAGAAGTAMVAAAAHYGEEPAGLAQMTEKNDQAIWDAHVHLSGVAGAVEQRVDQLLVHADRLGIKRLVVFMGTTFTADPSPERLRQENDEVLRAIAHAPRRVLGFVYLNPKHVDESLDEMDRCICRGPMVGVKLWIAIRCHEPELDPLVRRAVELKVPLLQHTYWKNEGNLPGESNPLELVALATRHPDASFICAHTGSDWERGIRAIRRARNVSAEISGSDPTSGFVEMAVRELGPERVVFGSDAGGRSFASQLAKVTSADLPESARRMILGENLRRLLAPALDRKKVAIR